MGSHSASPFPTTCSQFLWGPQVVCLSLRKPGLAAKSLWESDPKSCEWVARLSHVDSGRATLSLSLYDLPHLGSQVKIQPVAKYDWEQKYYYGNLIAVSNSFLAYAIRGE